MTTGIITNIQRCSTEDGPGIRTTLFLKGCPLHCLWCHNIETIDSTPRPVWHGSKCIANRACIKACPENALQLLKTGMQIDLEKCTACGACEEACPTGAMEIIGKVREASELVEELVRDRIFFETSKGGITISGGEPLLQSEFVIQVASALQEMGIHVALDTSGYATESVWLEVLKHVDLVLLDLKQMDPELHRVFTGVPLNVVLSNARVLGRLSIPVWIRTPIIPGHTDSVENVKAIARFIKKEMPNVERYDLLAFNKLCVEKYSLFGLEYPLRNEELIEREVMETLVRTARNEGIIEVTWSGMTRRINGQEPSLENNGVKTCG
jgi:pyruvate formate lyase activating enzyme